MVDKDTEIPYFLRDFMGQYSQSGGKAKVKTGEKTSGYKQAINKIVDRVTNKVEGDGGRGLVVVVAGKALGIVAVTPI